VSSHSRRSQLTLVLILAAALTSAARCATNIPDRLPNGSWGGEHIGMVVADTGATIEYDCAAGKITGPLALAANGDFNWTGIHSPGHGGPSRVDEPPDNRPARYTGNANSNTMQLTVTVLDGSIPPQTYTLRRGGEARVFRCL
jgi:hypothetical protein